jgi:cellobiose phosphorylase
VTACTGIHESCYGDIKAVKVEPGQFIRQEMTFSFSFDKTSANQQLEEKINSKEIDRMLWNEDCEIRAKRKKLDIHTGSFNRFSIDNRCFNYFLNTVKTQAESSSFGKVYGWSEMLGIRDIYQQMEVALLWEPERCRERIIESLSVIDVSGRAPRQYAPPVGDLEIGFDWRAYIDQGVWIITTLCTYIKVTGDISILEEIAGYYELHNGTAVLSDQKDSILAHLIRIMEYLLSCKDSRTGCARILHGDWNDALNGLGRGENKGAYGSGVSVMASLQVYQNLREMSELLSHVDAVTYAKEIKRYNQKAENLKQSLLSHALIQNKNGEYRIVHGWGDNQQYYVGSFSDYDGSTRISLTTHAFWIISGMYLHTPDVLRDILSAYQKLDSHYGLKTFDLPFTTGIDKVGGIARQFPGVLENAAVYVHATTFAILSLFMTGYEELAWEQIQKIVPITHSHLSHSPFVMPNAYMYNPEIGIDGESQNDWQTGSGAVLLKALTRYAFGYYPDWKGVWIAPVKSSPFTDFDFEHTIRGKKIHIRYVREGRDKREFTVNGKPVPSVVDDVRAVRKIFIPYEEMDRETVVNVID